MEYSSIQNELFRIYYCIMRPYHIIHANYEQIHLTHLT